MSKHNLVKLISDTGGMYVFDALSNNILAIESPEDFSAVSMSDLGHEQDLRLHSLEIEGIDNEVASNAKTLILEITEQCNLRCRYCIFDEQQTSERSHSSSGMSLETALVAVRDFYARTNGEEGYIVFYGGEPLLAFELIKQVVSYANLLSNYQLRFSLTTNGVSLSEDVITYLIENLFSVTVSLDGDRITHDKQRIAATGKGSYNAVTRNLHKLIKRDEVFAKKHVSINCVIASAHDLPAVNSYFASGEFNNIAVRFVPVSCNSVSITNKILSTISLKSIESMLSSVALPTPVEDEFIGAILERIEFRVLDSKAGSRKKLCIPFANRTYVRTNGDLQFCEGLEHFGRLANDQSNLSVASEILYREYVELRQPACSQCFAYNFCEMCPASFIRNNRLDVELADAKCSQFRNTVELALRIYINRMECSNAS